MNKYDQTYHEIQILGRDKANSIAREIISKLESIIGHKIEINNGYDDINIFLSLLVSDYQPLLLEILEQYDYSVSAELQYIIANACLGNGLGLARKLPSLRQVEEYEKGTILHTSIGKITVCRANLYIPNTSLYIGYGNCHNVCLNFIKDFNNVSASTALIGRPLYGKHYHSFINFGDNVIDLAHNAYMSRVDYDLTFNPEVINTVTGAEIDDEEKRINSKESLSNKRSLLLRLALDKQVK